MEKKIINTVLNKLGIQVKRYPDYDHARRIKIVKYYNIDTIFDIGANAGFYALDMREYGFNKKIISFEPQKLAFEKLKKLAEKDSNWQAYNYALGDEDSKSIIHIAGNSYSSSILNMLPLHLKNAPQSKFISQEEIEIKKIDSIFNSFCTSENRVMIKIDTQGYEKYVIDGASGTLNNIILIQLEMSLFPLYENEMLFVDMINYLDNKGFQLLSLENGISDTTSGHLLQVDGIFVQRSFLEKA